MAVHERTVIIKKGGKRNLAAISVLPADHSSNLVPFDVTRPDDHSGTKRPLQSGS